MRDFIPSALAFLMKGEHLIVKNFLVETARLQSREKMVDLFKLGQGVMPASFKVHHRNPTLKTESLLADFGETAIGRVAPVDSGLWWIILLRAYTRWTGPCTLFSGCVSQRGVILLQPCFVPMAARSMTDRRMVGAHLQLLLFFIVIVDNTPRASFLRFSRILLFYCIISSRISIRIETGLPIR